MRYLCLAILLVGCASAPKSERSAGAAAGEHAAPSAAELSEMLRTGAAHLERDTVINAWLIRDTSGAVVVTGMFLGEEDSGVPRGYGDNLVK